MIEDVNYARLYFFYILFDRKDLKGNEENEKNVAVFKRTFIVLNFTHLTDWDNMDIIAHEIAHFILGHYNSQYFSRNAEQEAEDLAKKWGFRHNSNFTVTNNIVT